MKYISTLKVMALVAAISCSFAVQGQQTKSPSLQPVVNPYTTEEGMEILQKENPAAYQLHMQKQTQVEAARLANTRANAREGKVAKATAPAATQAKTAAVRTNMTTARQRAEVAPERQGTSLIELKHQAREGKAVLKTERANYPTTNRLAERQKMVQVAPAVEATQSALREVMLMGIAEKNSDKPGFPAFDVPEKAADYEARRAEWLNAVEAWSKNKR